MITLVKRQDRYDLYNTDGAKIASSAKNPFGKLSKENCDSIFGVVDVEKLFLETPHTVDNEEDYWKIRAGYITGFNKAMELQKDKLFTENDIARAFIQGVYTKDKIHYNKEKYIQSLKQSTEIEVEIVMGDILDTKLSVGAISIQYANYVTITRTPKLDENGCLILKKKI